MREQTTQTDTEQTGQSAAMWADLGLTPLLLKILGVCWGREIVSHAELMKRAWGKQVPRINLDVAVHRLNKKLRGKVGLKLSVRRFDVYMSRGNWA
ncbi:MAG: hypothetical protein O6941_05315 [Planctomycetota bacterium]|nr:hypothetical protein [Planctomycetota bacterium]MCZ6612034.1 hypothetical protein [Planctomycetota bacterium]MCZ6734368.1 hypothetical protein [Planctomycetota bacterium]MCZ6850610.1 hypothetical protein [Planctomycetota bacterium]